MIDIDYTVNESKRAKKVSIRISERKGVVVTVPFKKRVNIERVIAANESWIRNKMAVMALPSGAEEMLLPERVSLESMGLNLNVVYRPTTAKTVSVNLLKGDELVVFGNVANDDACVVALNKWLQEFAKQHLPEMLQEYAAKVPLDFAKCNVRGQKSRWGSCSSNRAITLNRKLLFLPQELVEYIFLHELCHTVEMNHSTAFWGLVEQFDADYKAKDKLVTKYAWRKYIPRWAD